MVSFLRNCMSKELPQISETKVRKSNSTALEKARRIWGLSLATTAAFLALESAAGCNTIDQKPNLNNNPTPSASLTHPTPERKPIEAPIWKPVVLRSPETTPKTEVLHEEKPKYSTRHLNAGETFDFESNVIVAGDVDVNGQRFYDDDSETGLIVNLPQGGKITAPFGADVLIPTSLEDTNEIIEQKKQEMIENGCGNKCKKGVNVVTINKEEKASEPTSAPPEAPPPSPVPADVPKTYLMPGEFIFWTQEVETTKDEDKRAIHMPLKEGNRDYVRIEFRTSSDPHTVYHEGDLIVFRQQKETLTAIMTVKSGAGSYSDPSISEVCFREVGLNIYSREENWTDKPITQTKLAENICIPKSVYAFNIHQLVGEDTVRTTTYLVNYSPEADQRVTYRVNESQCFPYSDRQFQDEKGITSPDTPRTIPRKGGINGGIAVVRMTTTLPANTNTDSLDCPIKVLPILEDKTELP